MPIGAFWHSHAMQNQLAQAAYAFIERAPMKGAEAETAAAVKQWLRRIAAGELTVFEPPKVPPAETEK